ncbi:hypothetical protein NKH18_07010 [Streptomyces sp. M10(2022)]
MPRTSRTTSALDHSVSRARTGGISHAHPLRLASRRRDRAPPDYGIVAANPKQLAANTWMLKEFYFHPVPDQPTLYALADQRRDGQGRATGRSRCCVTPATRSTSMPRSTPHWPRKRSPTLTGRRAWFPTSRSPNIRSSASSLPPTTTPPHSGPPRPGGARLAP